MKRRGLLACMIIAILLLPRAVYAVNPEGETVRLGYCDYSNFMAQNENGDLVGFAFEYLQEVNQYIGWNVEYVDCGSWENALSLLAEGQIDLLPAVHHTPQREEQMLFPALPMTYISTSLYTRASDERYFYEDFSAFYGMRVGMVSASKNSEYFLSYAAEHSFTVIPVYYAESRQALAALDKGSVDAVAVANLGRGNSYRRVAQFDANPVYLAVNRARPDLLEQLDRALYTLKLRSPDFETQLYAKYFSISTDQKPVFTRQEREFIQDSGVVTAVYNASGAPLEHNNRDDGAFSGVVADVFAQISEDTGLKFHFVPAEDFDACLELAQSPEVDLVCAMPRNYLSSLQNELITTQYYLKAPMALISRSGGQTISRVAALDGYLTEQLSRTGRHAGGVTYFSTPEECFDALLSGQVDGIYLNSYMADYMLTFSRYENLALTTMTGDSVEVGIGISRSADPLLFSILDKSIQHISSDQVNQLILKNAARSGPITLRDLVRQYPITVVGVMAALFMVPLLLLSCLLVIKSRSKRKIEDLLYVDRLTGLWNLNKFRLETEARLRGAKPGEHALIYLDIKQFHAINDSRGFAEGDAILQALGQILTAALREEEHCARVSADQFVLLLNYTQRRLLEARCVEMSRALTEWGVQGGKTYRLVLAFGAYLVDETEEGDVSLMLDLANYARRSVSSVHESRVVLYDAAMRQTALYQRELSDRMQTALEREEFLVYFQPKVDMMTGRLVGSEALVRWNYPDQGILYPGRFVPYFESNGFILELDLYVFEHVCQALRRWMDHGIPLYPVSCNFSPLHTADFSFSQRLRDIADRYDVPHRLLEIEVTESVFMRDLDDFSRHFHLLKGMDFPISIDDFGSGYSSLGLLQKFEVDVVKLDRSFIQEGIHSSREHAVLRGILNMAEELGVSIICEGVETLDQAKILQQLGCRYAQGFYYAKPMPEPDFCTLLAEAPRHKS